MLRKTAVRESVGMGYMLGGAHGWSGCPEVVEGAQGDTVLKASRTHVSLNPFPKRGH